MSNFEGMMRRYLIYLAIMVFVLFSCKKPENAGFPTVQITAPTGTATYTATDTITVKANVSDANSIRSIGIYIINSQGVTVTAVASVPVTSKQMSFTFYYPINNIHLTTGAYTLVVRVSNGTNATNGYQAITINAVPTVRLGIYAVTRGSTVTVTRLDSNYNASAIYNQTGDYSSSDINTYYQQLYVAAADSGNMNAINMPLGGQLWGATGLVGPQPYFTNVYSYGNAVFTSDYQGFIKYYNSQGNLAVSFKVSSGYYPIKTLVWDGYLFAEQKNVGALTRNLVLYNTNNNFLGFEQATLPGPLVAMYGQDNQHIFVFGNTDSGSAYLEQFSIPGNLFFSPTTLPNAKLLSVAQVDSATYLMGFNNGNIYEYTFNPNGAVIYISGVTASKLQYDYAEQRIIASSGNHIYEYGYYSKALLHSTTLADSVLNVHVLYNK